MPVADAGKQKTSAQSDGADIPALAVQHQNLIRDNPRLRLARQIKVLEQHFQQIYQRISQRVELGEEGTRAEEWLLDNRHIVQQALELVHEALPAGYLKVLPKVQDKKGNPDLRARQLADALLRHGEMPLDMELIHALVAKYQQNTVLTTGELWALPALLRLSLLQELSRAGSGILGEKGRDNTPLPGHEGGEVASIIISLRELQVHDWRHFVESLSRVERILEDDPAAAYDIMDFETRDAYRGTVEELSRQSGQSEERVAQQAINLCREHASGSRQNHVGYYLVDRGRRQLEKVLGTRRCWRRILYGFGRDHAGGVYFTGMSLVTLPLLVVSGVYLGSAGSPAWLVAAVMLVAAVPVLGLALALINGLITHSLPPHRLGKLDFGKGIPVDCRTAVVMPVLFASEEDIHHILEAIEINYLNNTDDNLVYIVLSDFADADQAQCEGDRALLAVAEKALSGLNQRYASKSGKGPFLLLHRRRLWNAAEGCWMGWERKRGKLIEFNHLVEGRTDTTFETCLGERGALNDVRYVITLDADTHMPPGTARRMVGTLAHPLNRAVIDPGRHRVIAGYGFLQPRLEVAGGGGESTAFSRIFSGDTTVDLYTHAISDAYQDLFGEGIYAGKGIYDPQVFEQTLAGRLPDNAVLSHDLLEGIFGGAALISDATLYEQYPPNIFTYLRRNHRWIRGDWQLVPWLRRRVPTSDDAGAPNPLPLIHQWKIIDNLRRSLQAPAMLLLFLAVWGGLLPGSIWAWTLGLLALTAVPLWVEVLSLLWRGVAHPPGLRHLMRSAVDTLPLQLQHWLISLALIPCEAQLAADAALRTLYRVFLSHRHLLEWTTAAHVDRAMGGGLSAGASWRAMRSSPILASLVALVLAVIDPVHLAVASPLLLGWFFAPQLAYAICRPRRIMRETLEESERRELRLLARRTWFFFQEFMGPDDHWLPPDNYQEEPRAALARRTSPTNIGLGLLSMLSAYDFGYLGIPSLIARLNNSFDRMGSLERYRGHFFNWYETRELHPLQPRYVSTVDSGNLAGCLITLARGLESLLDTPISGRRLVRGVVDTLMVIGEDLRATDDGKLTTGVSKLVEQIETLGNSLERETDKQRWWRLIDDIYEQQVPALQEKFLTLVENDNENSFSTEALGRIRRWLDELHHQAVVARRNQESLEPWQRLFEALPTLYREDEGDSHLTGLCQQLRMRLNACLTLRTLPAECLAAGEVLARLESALEATGADVQLRSQAQAWNAALRDALQAAVINVTTFNKDLQRLAQQADHWVVQMDFRFLYDRKRHLFHIGYNVSDAALDPNYYDLLASEARLSSFVAIAKGDVPARHWLHMDRPFRRLHGEIVLMSWGATLFEYLMPRLLMETPDNSLLGHACRNAIETHQRFTGRMKLPWGISESGYYQLDSHFHYQYQAFGAPGIGFRRDIGDRIVISPYSSMMGLPFAASSVMDNLKKLRALRGYGQFGLYEAIDFGRTAKAVPRRARVVRSYMSHHQGMIMLALNNFLHGDIMLRRFHSDPRIVGLSPLLHERVPASPPALIPWARPKVTRSFRPAVTLQSWSAPVQSPTPQYNLLSNGHYGIVQSSDGGGGSYREGIMLTRWRADPTRIEHGHWGYIRDRESGELFSIGLEPCGGDPGNCSVHFGPHRSEYQRREQELFCRMRTALGSQHDIEARCLIIKNESASRRKLLLGSYAEVVLAPKQEDQRHPAFAKLFVESQYLAGEETMLYRRRPRSSTEKPVYLAHSVFVRPGTRYKLAWETDRMRFLGRGGSADRPRGLQGGLECFSGTTGPVLDPIIATGMELELAPHEEAEVVYLTGAGKSKRELMSVMRSYRSQPRVGWIFAQARMQSEHELANLKIDPADMRWMTELFSAVMAPGPHLRVAEELLGRSRNIQSALWSKGISGDHPILLVRLNQGEELGFVDRVLQAHTYWCGRGMPIDLVIVDEESGGYMQPTRDRLQQMIPEMHSRTHRKLEGGVFVVAGREMPSEERVRLFAAARVVLDAGNGSVAEQMGSGAGQVQQLPPFVPVRSANYTVQATPELARPDDLLFDNGIGGFSADGREYIMHLEKGQRPPVPWVNVIANPLFGCLVSEAGSCCTWSGNSGEHRLTPWHNDPVRDPTGEALYLRDEETAEVWSPTLSPRPADAPYQVRHGAGYTEYRHHSHGLKQVWRVFVDRDAPVKIGRLTLTNCWDSPRRFTATYYVEWVMGLARDGTWPHLVSEYDAHGGVLLARNAFSRDEHPGVAFLTANLPPHGVTTDRTEFLGRTGSIESPDALSRIGLSGRVDSGGDNCAAYQVHIDLPAGETRQVFFVLGEGRDRASALDLAARFSQPERAETAFGEIEHFWEQHLGSVQVETGDQATDLLVNRWLPYQTLACRLWGRSGYYQSSGAFGFRDQLQDVMTLLWSRPEWAREHILKAASRQFQDGDVLHWWHENPLRGVRTRCSDDLLWLPYVTAKYISSTGDYQILRESVSYLAGPALEKDENERFAEYENSNEWGSLYEHCCRAIARSSVVGPHGLPLIGNGDWNDGFNRISTTGRGESVWLTWFLIRVCRDFVPLCECMGDVSLAGYYRELGETMQRQIEESGWDGAWYRRAYYDDGTPVGSAQSDECKIDLIAQSWSVLSTDTPSDRARQAMQAAYQYLVKEDDRLILLLAPPFDKTRKDPGYIKGYPPGIRENGGQYTHAATWSVWAAAGLGDGEQAMRLFRLLNPILRTADAEAIQRYCTEPYVLAGDIYSMPPHVGRGGWTWYTGASGWLYRAALEALLGLKLESGRLSIRPCLPDSWPSFRVTLRHGRSRYEIQVENCSAAGTGRAEWTVDGERVEEQSIPLDQDGQQHQAHVRFIMTVSPASADRL